MSTIDSLPPEILSIVFLHVVSPFNTSESPERVPIVLGLVCRLWRTLSLALPGLWASLEIKWTPYIFRPPLHTIHTHLLRSADHPLSIGLYNSDYSDSPRNPLFPEVLAALVSACTRWRFISIELGSEATQETVDAITLGNAPLLQSFHCDAERSVVPLTPLRALQGCPRLESLAWYYLEAPSGLMLENDPWLQLTALDLKASLTAHDCLTFLQLSPCLSTAIFEAIDSPSDAASHRHLHHATLHTLKAEGTYTIALLSALTLPALVKLRLITSPYSPVENHAALPALLSRSTPPLRKLTLMHMRFPEAVLLRTFGLLGDVQTLLIIDLGPNHVPYTATLVAALHPRPHQGQTPLCPRMSTLNISAIEAPDGVFTAMLRARWGEAAYMNGVASLQKVQIELVGDGHERDHAEIRTLNAEGLVVKSPWMG